MINRGDFIMYKLIKGSETSFEKKINEIECEIMSFSISADGSNFAALVKTEGKLLNKKEIIKEVKVDNPETIEKFKKIEAENEELKHKNSKMNEIINAIKAQ